MLNFGNKEFRNLQEQVLKNMQDIQDIEEGATVLASFGIKVVGQVPTAGDLPDPVEYYFDDGEYGDAYLVGTEAPYEYYIFTRAFEGQDDPSWFNLGVFPQPGPQGDTGATGSTGQTPNIAAAASVSTLSAGQAATVSVTKSGTNENPTLTFAFAIPQGAQGIQGPQGAQGPQGPQGQKGDKGEKGEQGGLIDIVGIVATAGDLPAPSTLQKLDAAYLVGTSPDYELYVQVGETPSTALWTNLGAINEGTVVTVNGVPQTVWEAAGQYVTVYEGQLVNTLYGQAAGTGNGQTHVPYGTAATANNIVQRDVNGQVEVPQTPTSNAHAASKKYVDDEVASAFPVEQAGDLIVGTGTNTTTRLAIGSANQVLSVNSSGTGLEYETINSVPAYTSSDNDKVLKVNSTGTDIEWGAVSGGGGGAFTDSAKHLISQTSNADYFDAGAIDNLHDTLFLFQGNSSSKLLKPCTASFGSGGNIVLTKGINMSAPSGNLGVWFPTMSYSLYMGYASSTANATNLQYINLNNSILFNNNKSGNNQKITLTSAIYDQTACYSSNSSTSRAINSAILFSNGSLYLPNGALGWSIGIGEGLSFAYNKTGPINNKAIFGTYNSITNLDNSTASDILIVGCGSSNTNRSNCFATGNDGTNDYIYIGDTKITETQLQALLATI